MSDDLLRRFLRYFARPEPAPASTVDLATVDERLDNLERTLPEIHARLRLLERQADPRRLRGDG